LRSSAHPAGWRALLRCDHHLAARRLPTTRGR
jgi:hypothetical protein